MNDGQHIRQLQLTSQLNKATRAKAIILKFNPQTQPPDQNKPNPITEITETPITATVISPITQSNIYKEGISREKINQIL